MSYYSNMTKKRGRIALFLVFGLNLISTFFLASGKTSFVSPPNDPPQASVLSTHTAEQVITKEENVIKAPQQPVEDATVNSVPPLDIALTDKRSKMSIYLGPGAVRAHTDFEQWLGRPIPYATDYFDYKGGWQKDFIDSKLWLMEPWGRWVRERPGRRLVIGVPMLQNSNYGQFNEGARGDFDQYFISMATELVKQNLGDSILRLGYEANCDTIGPWQATSNPSGYILLFRHLVSVLKSIPGSNFSFDWTVCNGLQTGKTLSSFESFYPGNDVVDMIGIDIYDVKWNDTSVTPEERWEYTIKRGMGVNELLAFARSKDKPVSYPEWGLYRPGDSFSGGGDNPYFISKMTELINTTSPVYQSYFNINWGGGVLHDFSKGEALFKLIYGTPLI
jgi:hypothetical protein